ncbi:patatin-like phospholipase family protein [Ottowia thiooxydans]|uniref:patatin-like phospholipase family protein n=1 Tax=Ottowia thiooxydans TaxID=219182 RepID=UPI0003F89459
MEEKKQINLALQGGGAHGAFTWGVLDALLADGRLAIDGISGTSAGALNAVALAHGWASAQETGADPGEGARASLANVWNKVMVMGEISEGPGRLARLMMGALPSALGRVSPYQSNPLDYNPLRKLIESAIDFELLARLKSLKVFVGATDVETGRAEIFTGKRLTAQAVMASACLPMMFQAPEIDGRQYWDGGYSGNPAFAPLIEQCDTNDVLLVQINPLRQPGRPTTAAEIIDRVNDITFNASLIAQMRTIALINDMVEKGVADEGLKQIRLHRIDGGKAMLELPPATKVSPQRATVEKLFTLGSESAQRWLKRNLSAVGQKSSINVRRDYGDPLRLDFGQVDAVDSDAEQEEPPDQPGPAAFTLWSKEEREQSALKAAEAVASATQAALGLSERLDEPEKPDSPNSTSAY